MHDNSISSVVTVKQQQQKVIGEPWFPGLTLKTVLKWDFYWNKCTSLKFKLY
jgi:hypothetical protein